MPSRHDCLQEVRDIYFLEQSQELSRNIQGEACRLEHRTRLGDRKCKKLKKIWFMHVAVGQSRSSKSNSIKDKE